MDPAGDAFAAAAAVAARWPSEQAPVDAAAAGVSTPSAGLVKAARVCLAPRGEREGDTNEGVGRWRKWETPVEVFAHGLTADDCQLASVWQRGNL